MPSIRRISLLHHQRRRILEQKRARKGTPGWSKDQLANWSNCPDVYYVDSYKWDQGTSSSISISISLSLFFQ